MQLFYREYGKGTPLIILHGLFGCADNWQSQAKKFSEYFRVIVVDVRNHGRSPWSEDFDYPILAKDVLALLKTLEIKNYYLLGHSMGAKIAMHLAQINATGIEGLILVDMGVKKYEPHHQHILKGIHSIPLNELSKRSEAEPYLAAYIDELGTRQFLLKNLYWIEKGKLAWRMNVSVLEKQMPEILSALPQKEVLVPSIFIRGENSNYILEDDITDIESLFPDSEFVSIPNAGHWVHAESPDNFIDQVLSFCLR